MKLLRGARRVSLPVEEIVEAMRDGLAIHDDRGVLVGWNAAATALTGWSLEEAASRFPAPPLEGLVDLGGGRWIEARAMRMRRGRSNAAVTIFSDGRAQASLWEAYARLNDMATTDSLTGLPNRLLARDRLELSVTLARRDGRSLALLYVDLDHFKLVNDTLGHSVGDELLRQVAARIRTRVRESDTAARVGGDEFIVILHSLASATDAEMVATNILVGMQTPFSVGEHELYLTCSIGIAVFPEHGADPESLLQHADLAMYEAKAQGGNASQLYAAVMSDDVRERLVVAGDLHRAIERGELEVHYQPQYDLDAGEVFGLEALVRWRHPTRGLTGPERFLSVAEDEGAIVEIDRWVMEQACRDARKWLDAGLHLSRIAVNISARTLCHADVASLVDEALAVSGIDANRLELEVSEHVVASRLAERKLFELSALGVQLAIDDFGTGHSSLGQLKRFPFDAIKLDRSFIADLGDQPTQADVAVLRAIVSMAADLGLRCIAEGVETKEQRRLLRFLRCHLMQGYLYGGPLEASEVPAILAGSRRPAATVS